MIRLVALLLLHLVIVVSALIVAISFKIFLDYFQKIPFEVLSSIALNWSNPYPYEIPTSTEALKSSCTPLITSFWVGTEYGCYCYLNQTLTRGTCKTSDSSSYNSMCSVVPNTTDVSYSRWKETNLCVLNYRKTHYFSYIKTKSTCPKSSPKSCGPIDLEGNNLCIQSERKCPIDDLVFFDSEKELRKYTNYSIIKLNYDNGYLAYKNSGTSRAINEIRVSEKQPCFNPYTQNNPSKRSSYVLEKYLDITCNAGIENETLLDNRFTPIGTEYDYNTFLSENDIRRLSLPLFPTFPTFKVQLFYKTYVGINILCDNYLKQSILSFYKDKTQKGLEYSLFYSDLLHADNTLPSRDVLNFFYIINYLTISLYLVYALFSFIFKHCFWKAKYRTYCKKENIDNCINYSCEENFHCSGCFLHTIDWIVMITNLIQVSSISFCFSRLKSIPAIIDALDGCLDKYTQASFDLYSSDLKTSATIVTTSLTFSVVVEVLMLTQYCLWNKIQETGEDSEFEMVVHRLTRVCKKSRNESECVVKLEPRQTTEQATQVVSRVDNKAVAIEANIENRINLNQDEQDRYHIPSSPRESNLLTKNQETQEIQPKTLEHCSHDEIVNMPLQPLQSHDELMYN